MADILTASEVREAIRVEPDFSSAEITRYQALATSYLLQKTGRDWSMDSTIHPLAKQCAILYIRNTHFGSEGYSREHDYTLGIASLICDLQNIVDLVEEDTETEE